MEHTPDSQPTAGAAQTKPEIIKLGLDLHARQVTECRQLDGSTPKPAQKWEPGANRRQPRVRPTCRPTVAAELCRFDPFFSSR
ncbi:MAG: hypothetical protein JOY92_15435 [Verrucomicrobia bacterium]|nr:hypothetical protein [Verrucomicrobiota bacterium]